MLNLYDKVFIKTKKLSGTIVDIHSVNGISMFTVESDLKGKHPDGYGDTWPLFECKESELTLLPDNS